MITLPIYYLAASGLFDFDLTFFTEALLFLILSFFVTFTFLSPISNQLNTREDYLKFNTNKSFLLLNLANDELTNLAQILTSEIFEMDRQKILLKDQIDSKFEKNILNLQKNNIFLLSSTKGKLGIKSAFLLSKLNKEFNYLINNFFSKKFNSL